MNPLPFRNNPLDDNRPVTVGVATAIDRQERTQNISKRPSFQFHATARGNGGVSTENSVNLFERSLDTPISSSSSRSSSSSSSAITNNIEDDNKIVFNVDGKNEVFLMPIKSSSSSHYDDNVHHHENGNDNENENEIENHKIKSEDIIVGDKMKSEKSEDVIVGDKMKSEIPLQKNGTVTGKRSLSVEHDPEQSKSVSEPLPKTSKISKIPKLSKIPKRRVSIGKTHITRQESSSLQKVLKRERRTSFKLLD